MLDTKVQRNKDAPQIHLVTSLDGVEEPLWIGPLAIRELSELSNVGIQAEAERRAEALYSRAGQLSSAPGDAATKKLMDIVGNYPETNAARKAMKVLGIDATRAKQISADALRQSFSNNPDLARSALSVLLIREDAERRRQRAQEEAAADKLAQASFDPSKAEEIIRKKVAEFEN